MVDEELTYRSRILNTIHETLENDRADDAVEVEKFSYKQELDKHLTIMSMLGLGFGLMSPPLSLGVTMGSSLIDGGPLTIMGGYTIVYVCSFVCALSLAEITSKYPTELHSGAALIAHPDYSLICSWFTGFFLLIGNWLTSTSITFAGAQIILSTVGIVDSKYEIDSVLTVIMFYLVVTVCGVINLKFSKYLEFINKLCVYWIVYSILFIDVLLLIFSRNHHSLKYVFTHFDNSFSGWPPAMAFIIGFQQANFMLQGFGLLPSVSDEVEDAERTVSRGIVLSVLLAGGAGFIFLIPILAVLPDVSLLIGEETHGIVPIVLVFKLATRSVIVSFFLVILIIGNLLFSGIGSIATSSRAVFSMSRDGALPFADVWTHVHAESESKVPKNSVMLSMGISYLLGLLSLVSSTAFNAFVGAAVISLCAASLIPIVSLLLGARKKVRGAAFKLKYVGFIINIISTLWLAFTIFVLSLPPQLPVTASSMNYASLVFVLFVLIITVLWFVWGRHNFHGPLVDKGISETSDSLPMLTMTSEGYQKLNEPNVPARETVAASDAKSTAESVQMSVEPSYEI